MIEDYYKILKIRPTDGVYKVSIRYLRISRMLLKSNLSENRETFFQLNRAFEVLRKPEVRKYYDILYIEYTNNTLDQNNPVIIQYTEIIQNHNLAGNQKAEKLINDPIFLDKTKINQSWFLALINFIFYLNPAMGNFRFIPITGFLFLILGMYTILGNNGISNPFRLAPGITLMILGILIIIFNFRQFIIDRMNK